MKSISCNGKLQASARFNRASRFGPPRSCKICLNQVWLSGLRSPVSLALSRRQFGLATRALTAHPPNWIRINLSTGGGPNLLARLNHVHRELGLRLRPQTPLGPRPTP